MKQERETILENIKEMYVNYIVCRERRESIEYQIPGTEEVNAERKGK